jgi:hypothetical protein
MFTYGVIAVLPGWSGICFSLSTKPCGQVHLCLYTGGLATIALALSYWLIDVQGRKRFTYPFVVFGANAITAYVLSGFIPSLYGDDKNWRFVNLSNIFCALFFAGKRLVGKRHIYSYYIMAGDVDIVSSKNNYQNIINEI